MTAERLSELGRRVAIYAALADRHRLGIVDRLSLSDLTPSELVADLGIGSNLLAHHLRILENAGLVERLASSGDGRRRYLRLAWPTVEALPTPGPSLAADGILFVCTANSARSQLAAALWNRVSDVRASSAGTHPADAVHPFTVRAGKRAGLDLSHARPRALEDLDDQPDLVVTVCDRAHEELERSGVDGRTLHWSVPDPVDGGSPGAFDDTLSDLELRVSTLAPHVVRRPQRRLRSRARP